MCGRTSLAVDFGVIASVFDVTVTDAVEEYVPQYNVDPSDGLVAVTNTEPSVADVIEWGFIPEWADEPEEVPNPINVRSESVMDSGMFRSSFTNKRCLLLADGFYEWQGERGSKQPYRIVREDREPFAFAGIWSQWKSNGSSRETVAILTTEPNDVVAEIHDRMPVMLDRSEHEDWLSGDAATAMDLLDVFPSGEVEAFPVSKRVNNPSVESPELVEPVDIGDQAGLDDFGA
jgi:putative SOS response-associated peptidase YedK